MTAVTILQGDKISVYDYRCTAGPDSKPFVEQHTSHSIAYVRKGSFGCTKRGRSFELVTGSVMVGHPELMDAIGGKAEVWRTGCAPPLPELMVLGELAQAASDGRSDVGLDEVGQAFASRFVEVVSGRRRETAPT